MKDKPKQKKPSSAKTKQNINNFYSRYYDLAIENKIVWNYKRASELYKQAKKENRTQKELFRETLDKSFQNKSYYVKRKYEVDIKTAREVVNNYLLNNVKYVDNPLLELKEKTISGSTALMFLNEYLVDTVKSINYNGVEYSLNQFRSLLPELKDELKEMFDELDINDNYSRSIIILDIVEFKNKNGETIRLKITTFRPEDILKTATEFQAKNSDWKLLN